MRTRTIKVDMLARVEGEGGLAITMSNGGVKDLRLNIFEPPRFFEGKKLKAPKSPMVPQPLP